jgi:hypothetical protein
MITAAGAIADSFTMVKPWAASDSDGDGMSDEFEMAYGLNPGSALDALLDSDNDGTSNRDEYRAGTDPLDFKSRLVRSIERSGNGFVVRFSTVPTVRYYVDYSNTLTPGTWVTLSGELIGTGGEMTVTDTPPPGTQQRFYRVRGQP